MSGSASFQSAKEILISGFGFAPVSRHGIRAADLEMGQRPEKEVLHDSLMIEKLLEFGRCCRTVFLAR